MDMQTRNAVVRARVNESLKNDAEAILLELGVTMSEVINALLCQIKLQEGIPFEIKKPNKTTQKVLDDSAKGKEVKRFKTTDALFKDLGI